MKDCCGASAESTSYVLRSWTGWRKVNWLVRSCQVAWGDSWCCLNSSMTQAHAHNPWCMFVSSLYFSLSFSFLMRDYPGRAWNGSGWTPWFRVKRDTVSPGFIYLDWRTSTSFSSSSQLAYFYFLFLKSLSSRKVFTYNSAHSARVCFKKVIGFSRPRCSSWLSAGFVCFSA